MRTMLALCCAVALGGCAIVINPNDGDVRHAESNSNAIRKRKASAVFTLTTPASMI
ncbi:hypothetical protein CLU90_3262 [Janthinobacterium sp. 67]|uniref:hypothetical protein n=1 Tax=Janthinobacterium sp. 67 TaxID=2035207 RepID=UPI000CB76E63|nr:hypothetical protein [Janthinobacterium sp. 67]PJJ20030.1 hypothetical protein CLU90_3262 [Janthinobacterium sp. 67]